MLFDVHIDLDQTNALRSYRFNGRGLLDVTRLKTLIGHSVHALKDDVKTEKTNRQIHVSTPGELDRYLLAALPITCGIHVEPHPFPSVLDIVHAYV